MKLYTVKCKDYGEVFQFCTSLPPKEHLKREVSWMSPDLRTLKEIPFPKEGMFTCTDLSDMHYIFVNGELRLSWSDSAARDYPEDLTWERMIGGLVDDAISIGKELKT
jgi:hypothetical protein